MIGDNCIKSIHICEQNISDTLQAGKIVKEPVRQETAHLQGQTAVVYER